MTLLANQVLDLEPQTSSQMERQSRILDDIDAMSDARRDRLNAALAEPSVFVWVLLIGFVLTAVLFGLYPPRPTFVVLFMFYTAFIGLVVYLILALSDPFGGVFGIDPKEFESILLAQQGG